VQTPDRLRGRVFAVLMVGQALFGMVGAVVAGALGQIVSVVTLLTVQGAGYVVAAVLLRLLAGRGPDSPAEPVPAAAEPLAPTPARAGATERSPWSSEYPSRCSFPNGGIHHGRATAGRTSDARGTRGG
jgi:hypothetical protein